MGVIVVLFLAWVLLYIGSRGVGFGEGKNAHGLSGDNEWYYQEGGHESAEHGHH